MATAIFLADESTLERMASGPGVGWAVLTLPE